MDFYVDPKDPNRFKCSVKRVNTLVTNQKHHPNCLPIVIADMSSSVHRMNGLWVDSSPQPLLDEGITNFKYAKPFMTRSYMGLQSKNDYQFLGSIKQDLKYQLGNHHYLDDVVIIKKYEDIKKAILENFCQRGPKYPIPASIKGKYLQVLRQTPLKAREAFYGDPYKFDPAKANPSSGSHAILITGVDVTNENEELHSVEWKNSWGQSWGAHGYTKVTFDFFAEATIFVPVLDLENRRRICRLSINTLVGHEFDIKDICFSARGHLLATASKDGVRIVDLCDASRKRITCRHLKMPDRSCPTALCFDDSSIVVATGSEKNTSLFMFGEDNSNKEKCCIKWHRDTFLQEKHIAKLSRAKLNGTTFLITSSEGAFIRIWHGQDYAKEFKVPRMAKDNIMTISPNGQYIATVSCRDSIVRVLVLIDEKNSPTKGESSEQAEEDFTFDVAFRLKGYEAAVSSLCFTPDSQRLFVASLDGSVRVWAINYSSSQPQILDLEHTYSISYAPQDFTKTKYYDHISISPDGKILAVAGASLLRWICVKSGEVLETIGRAHNGDITHMSWAPVPVGVGDKKVIVLATAGADKHVKLWGAPSQR